MDGETVIIVGGGPAGAATALTLARRGISSLILEASPDIGRKIGETLPPTGLPLLETLGVKFFLREPEHLACYGNQYVWGKAIVQEKLFLFHPHGNGWHLDRLHFERQLYEFTQNQGIRWQFGCKVTGVERDKAGHWRLAVAYQNECHTLNTRFLVDATGRPAKVAHFLGVGREVYDRLIGLAYLLPIGPEHSIAHYTYIEAVENGWWYAAPLPGNQIIAVFITDADLLDKTMLNVDCYLNSLSNTQLCGSLLPKAPSLFSQGKVIIRPASSSRLRQVFGEGWLAAGDAASAYDPISSYGLVSAMGGGFSAGNSIADHLSQKPEALPIYGLVHEQAYQLYLEMLGNQYQLEQRWSGHPFWRRRHRRNFARSSEIVRLEE